MTELKVPPYEVNIYLRFRYSQQCRPCCFSRARPANYQLDIELVLPAGHLDDIQDTDDLIDPVGFIVNGRLYTDDEPYWECLLEEGKIYNVAYLKRPFGFGILRLYDLFRGTPVFPEAKTPAPDPRNSTAKSRKAVLIKEGLILKGEKRGYRTTLSDCADRNWVYAGSLYPQDTPSRYVQRLRRILPDPPEYVAHSL